MATNIDDVINAYIALRDRVDQTKKKHAAELAPTREKMTKIEAWLQNQLQSQKLTNLRSKSGTAFLKEVTDVTVDDWDAVIAFIKEEGLWELLERKVSATVVKDYLASTEKLPPGVSMRRETVVQVRRG